MDYQTDSVVKCKFLLHTSRNLALTYSKPEHLTNTLITLLTSCRAQGSRIVPTLPL